MRIYILGAIHIHKLQHWLTFNIRYNIMSIKENATTIGLEIN